jgi:GSH-dependent disulfide-bond oxidoreductase
MAGQAVHFRHYAPEQIIHAVARYTDEVNRLYGVMNERLATREFLAGRYSIADMASVGWVLHQLPQA